MRHPFSYLEGHLPLKLNPSQKGRFCAGLGVETGSDRLRKEYIASRKFAQTADCTGKA
jgi:hypothetical protein